MNSTFFGTASITHAQRSIIVNSLMACFKIAFSDFFLTKANANTVASR